MTRFSICDKRYKIPHIKTLREYDDKFPEDYPPDINRTRISSSPAVLKSYTHISLPWEDPLPRVLKEPSPNLTVNGGLRPVRRHSWSPDVNNNTEILNKSAFLRKMSCETRRGSQASVPEAIKECSSDDELLEENICEEVDYMLCANCNQASSNSSIDKLRISNVLENNHTLDNTIQPGNSTYTNIIQSCYKCKHLAKNKQTLISTPPKIERRGSWHGETYTASPRRSRRRSLGDTTIDLPIIKEPFMEEDDENQGENIEIEKQVEQEVNKLKKFNTLAFTSTNL